ncbi:MAG: thioredoxin [Elusimicrobiales bacterium]
MQNLTTEAFKTKVFDFEKNKEWKFAGGRPCIVDFYADWCGPCKMLSPVLEELSRKYDGKLDVYKIDTDREQELAGAFGIQSIPTMLFVPMTGKPQMAQGALPRETLEKAINDVLGVK